VPDKREKITCTHLAVGRLENATQASIIVMDRRLVEQVTQGFFEGIAHAHLAKYVG
jgi:hypothetical protein